MCESHPCGSKIVASRIQTNFSHLTDNSESNCLKTNKIKIQLFFDVWEVVRTSLELLNNAQDRLEILWKSLPTLFWSHWKFFYTFGYHWKLSENLRRLLEVFRNLWKLSINLRKFRFCGDKISHAFYSKKGGRYIVKYANEMTDDVIHSLNIISSI